MIHPAADADQKINTPNPTPLTKRSIYFFTAVALLSLLGLADATYLTIEHVTGQSVRCTIIAGCSEVLSSRYAVVSGVPLALVGAAAYFTVFALATLAAFGYRFAPTILNVLVASMVLVSLWLIYLQAFVIHSFCQYCLFSAAISFGMGILLFARRRKG
jgi:uncharacterized membrane protein